MGNFLRPTITNMPGTKAEFIPAKRREWFVRLIHAALKLSLFSKNKVHISENDLAIVRQIPANTGIILALNHADEADPPVCLDLSLKCQKSFIFMCNREAFHELGGLAGLVLQSIGSFSVERGGHDIEAKNYSIKVVEEGKSALVIFPEGEIFYSNDVVQPFHSGAVEIGLQSMLNRRKTESDWKALVVPIAIKYKYRSSINRELDKRIDKMETALRIAKPKLELTTNETIQKRLRAILASVIQKAEREHNLVPNSVKEMALNDRLSSIRHALLTEIEKKDAALIKAQAYQARTIDRAWQISAEIRDQIKGIAPEQKDELKNDLKTLAEVAHLVSLQPDYIESVHTETRLAEVTKKLEREVLGIRRPRQVAPRNVHLKIGTPIDLAEYYHDYLNSAQSIRHKLSEHLRQSIQNLIDDIDAS